MIDISNTSNDELDRLAHKTDRKQVSAVNYDDFLSRELPPRCRVQVICFLPSRIREQLALRHPSRPAATGYGSL